MNSTTRHKDDTIRFTIGDSSLGMVLLAASDAGVCAILLGDDRDALVQDLTRRFGAATLIEGDADFAERAAQMIRLIETPALSGELPLDLSGTAFQRRVWQALRDIPAGATASYRDIACRIGAPSAVRAVAQACAANPVAIAVPCHRVVRTDGALSGYSWGVERKRALLEREARA